MFHVFCGCGCRLPWRYGWYGDCYKTQSSHPCVVDQMCQSNSGTEPFWLLPFCQLRALATTARQTWWVRFKNHESWISVTIIINNNKNHHHHHPSSSIKKHALAPWTTATSKYHSALSSWFIFVKRKISQLLGNWVQLLHFVKLNDCAGGVKPFPAGPPKNHISSNQTTWDATFLHPRNSLWIVRFHPGRSISESSFQPPLFWRLRKGPAPSNLSIKPPSTLTKKTGNDDHINTITAGTFPTWNSDVTDPEWHLTVHTMGSR